MNAVEKLKSQIVFTEQIDEYPGHSRIVATLVLRRAMLVKQDIWTCPVDGDLIQANVKEGLRRQIIAHLYEDRRHELMNTLVALQIARYSHGDFQGAWQDLIKELGFTIPELGYPACNYSNPY